MISFSSSAICFKRLFSFLFLTFFTLSSPVSAQDLWKKYSKLSGLTARFEQTKDVKSLGVKLKSAGTIAFKKPDYFEWQVVAPKNFGFIFKSGQIEFWENGKIVRSADTSKMDGKMLTAISHLKAWLTMDQAFIKSHYDFKKTGPKTYIFTPNGTLKIFNSILLTAGDTYPVKSIELLELSQDVITIEFSQTKMTYEK